MNRIFELGGAAIGMVPSRQHTVFGDIREPELGLVGMPTGIDRERIQRYASRGLIPVVPPLSCDPEGVSLNTNADDIALAVAQGMNAEKLVFAPNIPGVCRDPAESFDADFESHHSSGASAGGRGGYQGGMDS